MSTELQPQATRGASPWSSRDRWRILLWEYCWLLFCVWTPKPLKAWRLFWLKVFGARIHGSPFVHQRARINMPWHLTLHERVCIGDRSNLYALGEIEIGAGTIIAQESYICTGTHDLTDAAKPLEVAKVTIGEDVFIGLRAIILPGITIGESAVVGAGSVVTRSVPPHTTVAGNPARVIKTNSTDHAE